MFWFVIRTVLLALLMLGGVALGTHQDLFWLPSFLNEILIFFTLSNIGLYWLVTRFFSHRSVDFVKIYLGVTILKILFFGAFIFALMVLDRKGARINTVFFLACYFLFTTQEVLGLYRKTKSQKARNSSQKDQ